MVSFELFLGLIVAKVDVGLLKLNWITGFLEFFCPKISRPPPDRNRIDGLNPISRISRWWFQLFFIFTRIWGRFPIGRAYFSKGVGSTTNQNRNIGVYNPTYLDPWGLTESHDMIFHHFFHQIL